MNEIQLRQQIAKKIKEFIKLQNNKKKFIPGKTWVRYGEATLGDKEINSSVSSLLKGWFGLGKKAQQFEKRLAQYLDVKGSVLTNSGSSANLLATAAITSPLFDKHLQPGDEVITAACGYPTTVNPLFLYNLIPVFVDINIHTYNLDASLLEKSLTKKTRAVFIAHTLGNHNDMDTIVKFCRQYKLLLIEDNCDALGSIYNGKKTGSFGLLSTQSFYPPHHITMGEGGAVNYQDKFFEKIIRSLRDWGRSCWCRGDNTKKNGACNMRFRFLIDNIPYDHKYVFNQIGYNLKSTEPQAAIGLEQIKKFPKFIIKRKYNFNRLHQHAKNWQDYFLLPQSLPKSQPCWFAYPLTLRENLPFTRQEIITFLEKQKVQTRPLFAGNLTIQPAYQNVRYRKISSLENADYVFQHTFFVGIHQGLGKREIDYIAENIEDFIRRY